MEEHLLNIDVEQLIQFTLKPFYQPESGTKVGKFYWAPIIENKGAADPFITEPVEDLLNENYYSNEIDTFFGFNSAVKYILDFICMSLYSRKEVRNHIPTYFNFWKYVKL